MTIEEKLKHFTTVTIEGVHEECEKSLNEYKADLDRQFESHKAEAIDAAKLREKTLRDGIERKASKEYTMEQLHIKRKINRKQNELAGKLFEKVEQKLSEYREKPEYKELLVKQINAAKTFARDEEIDIVAHSISPLMHNEAFTQLGLDYVYLCFDVGTENLKTAVDGLKTLGVRGFNCTMPDKNLMCELADKLSPAAEMIGAVNTVVNDNGILTGHNTDGVGYMMAVKDAGYDIIGKNMTLMGAGGAATAVCVQAALDGVASINVFSLRDQFWDRAVKLVDTINAKTSCKASLYDIADMTELKKSIDNSYILTNGTSVGMAPKVDNSIINDASFFHEGLVVSDVIYNPKETKLLRMARENGCHTFNGLYMLLYQGAEAFKIWTGKDMPVDIVKEKYFS